VAPAAPAASASSDGAPAEGAAATTVAGAMAGGVAAGGSGGPTNASYRPPNGFDQESCSTIGMHRSETREPDRRQNNTTVLRPTMGLPHKPHGQTPHRKSARRHPIADESKRGKK